jgi:hypothetical protein
MVRLWFAESNGDAAMWAPSEDLSEAVAEAVLEEAEGTFLVVAAVARDQGIEIHHLADLDRMILTAFRQSLMQNDRLVNAGAAMAAILE